MEQFLLLVSEQPEFFATAGGMLLAVFVVCDMYMSSRLSRRSLLGRVLGYAPKPSMIQAKVNFQTADAPSLKAQEQLQAQLDTMQYQLATLTQVLELLSKNIQTSDVSRASPADMPNDTFTRACDLARTGGNFPDLLELGLSPDEAHAVLAAYRGH